MKLTKAKLIKLIKEEMNVPPVDKTLMQSLFRRLQKNFGSNFNITKSSVRDGEEVQYQITMEFKGILDDRGVTTRRASADTVDIYHIFKGQAPHWALLHANDDRQDIPANRKNLDEIVRIITIFADDLMGMESSHLSPDVPEEPEEKARSAETR